MKFAKFAYRVLLNLEAGGVGGRELKFLREILYPVGMEVLFLTYRYFLAADFTDTTP